MKEAETSIPIRRALLSVYNKTNLIELAETLSKHGVELIASGGTAEHLLKAGFAITTVEDFTGLGESLDGRLKTLHPKIHGGILAVRDDSSHIQALTKIGTQTIDLVVVNLYPFVETISTPGVSPADAIEQIDIGGPCLLRSAAKNHRDVVVLSEPCEYESFCVALTEGRGSIRSSVAKANAARAFINTANYDAHIANYLSGLVQHPDSKLNIPPVLALSAQQSMRYGENQHQTGSLCICTSLPSLDNAPSVVELLSGKELSYNNWLDIDSAWRLVGEFEPEYATSVIVKHNVPCGIAIGENVEEAYEHALDADPTSAFGGIVAFNKPVDGKTATKLTKTFLEVVCAPEFSPEALTELRRKPNLRVVGIPNVISPEAVTIELRSILGRRLLIQNSDNKLFDPAELKIVSRAQPSSEEWLTLLFAFRAVKHVRSNGIVIASGNRTVGIGAGQTNRLASTRIALENASDLAVGAVLASDGFFPFADSIELAAAAGIKSIIQPGGSIRDAEVIDCANRNNMAMVFTGTRHFKH